MLLYFGVLLLAQRSVCAQAIGLEEIVRGLASPVAVTHADDGSGRLFIALQGGQVLIYGGTSLLPEPFLDITAMVTTGGERGLLGIAFHPQYLANGFFYIDYTDSGGDTVIARYQVSADPNRADPDSALILLTVAQPFANHNGGQLQFGPDGYLYVAMGDGGSAGDPQNNAQNLSTLLGKILRIDVDAALPYAVPSDNPFNAIPDARPEIWALGLRNPWRFSFDRLTGDLLIGDVGQAAWEELNFQPAHSAGGENYGWRLMEGRHCFNPDTDCDNGNLTAPVIEYGHNPGCSITGGYRYRGESNPSLVGVYLYADFCSGQIWGATPDTDGNWTAEQLLDTDFQIATFGEDQAGEIYVAHRHPTDGSLWRIVETAAGPAASSGSGSGGCFIFTAASYF